MPVAIDIYEKDQLRGTYGFEVAPRVGEDIQFKGHSGRWRVVNLRHLAIANGPAQLQIAVEAVAE